MSFLSSLFQTRAIDAGDFEEGDPLWRSVTDSGERVNTETAIRHITVYACITLIADAIRALPVDVFQRIPDGRVRLPAPPWVQRPSTDQTWGQFIDFSLWSLLTHGNGLVVVTGRQPAFELFPVLPSEADVSRKDGKKDIRIGGQSLEEFTSANPSGEVLHIIGYTADGVVGLSPIEQAQQAIGSGLALEKYGNKFFSNSATPGAVIEMPTGSQPTQPQLESLARQFKRKHSGTDKAFAPLLLANGATYKPITVPNDQAQFLESQRFNVSQIARLYRVPPHLIGDVERSTSWGTGIEEQNIGFVTYTLMPWITRLEEAFSQLLPPDQFLKFNVNGLLRGDQKSRFDAYQVGIQNGFATRNEVRALEDLPPLDGGDVPLIPLNLTSAPGSDGQKTSARELTEMIQKIYLGVGKVIDAEEAREILNREGANLPSGFQPFPMPAPSQETQP